MGLKSKTQCVTKLKNLKCEKTQNFKKLKNSNITELKKLNVTKLKKNQFVTDLITLNCEREKSHKLTIMRKIF